MKKLIKTLTFYHDLDTDCDWTEHVPIISNCSRIKIKSVLAAAVAVDGNCYFLWSSLPTQPNGILVAFMNGGNTIVDMEHTFTNSQSIQFKVAKNGLGEFQSTVADTKLAINISFYE